MTKIKTESPDETIIFARDLASGRRNGIGKGSIVLLQGDVGSGKTTFVRGFASNWDLDSSVTSPTFTIINEYKNESVKIYHIDLYRLFSAEDLNELGLEDYISTGDYSFIEWPEKASPLLNINTVKIDISIGNKETERIFIIE